MQMETGQTILTRLLPKTGQLTARRVGGDGYYQYGWWKGLRLANNKPRFVSKTIDGDDVVIDRATGLMWPKDCSGAAANSGDSAVWNAAIDFCVALDFAGFTDWRLPNIFELISINTLESMNPSIITPFINVPSSTHFWSSTTGREVAAEAYASYTGYLSIGTTGKVVSKNLLAVRGGG